MTATPLDSPLFGPLFGDAEIAAGFSDGARLQAMLDVEAALARVQARLGMIPAESAARIAECCRIDGIDMEAVRAGTARDGVPTVALVKALRGAVGPEAAPHVHLGATTQDIFDTALVLQLRGVLAHMRARLDGVIGGLCDLAETHKGTVMAGRTHGQQAVPTTFGLKAAGWLAPLDRHRDRLDELLPRLLTVQFGGAAGTLAALGGQGLAVMRALAGELDLVPSVAPWHAQRDSMAELASWFAMVSGSLGKIAQDVILLSQTEVGEVIESGDADRGGSSTMPQKRNPMVSEAILAAARLNAGLLGAVHQSQIQEHERATHGWQVEWLTVPQMAVAAAGALANAERLAAGLVVRPERMRENIERAFGIVQAEAISHALAGVMPRAEAHARVRDAALEAARARRPLVDIVRDSLESEIPADAIDWGRLGDPGKYLGAAEAIIDGVISRARRRRHAPSRARPSLPC